jgi:hypothetical protein
MPALLHSRRRMPATGAMKSTRPSKKTRSVPQRGRLDVVRIAWNTPHNRSAVTNGSAPHLWPRIRAVADATIMTFIARVPPTGNASSIPGFGIDKILLRWDGQIQIAKIPFNATSTPK